MHDPPWQNTLRGAGQSPQRSLSWVGHRRNETAQLEGTRPPATTRSSCPANPGHQKWMACLQPPGDKANVSIVEFLALSNPSRITLKKKISSSFSPRASKRESEGRQVFDQTESV